MVSEFNSPYSAQYLLVCDRPSLMGHEEVKDVELCASEWDLHATLEEESALGTE
jgi:hypothetical protein